MTAEDDARRARQLALVEQVERARGRKPLKKTPRKGDALVDFVVSALQDASEKETHVPEDTEAKWERLRNTNIFDLSPEDRAALAAYQANHLRHELREYMTVLAEKVILPGFDALKTTFLSAFATTGEVARRDKLITAMRLIVVTDPPFLSDGWCLNRFLTYQKHKYPVSTGGQSKVEITPLSEKERAIVEDAMESCAANPADHLERLKTSKEDIETRRILLAKGARVEALWQVLDKKYITYDQVRTLLAMVREGMSEEEEMAIYRGREISTDEILDKAGIDH